MWVITEANGNLFKSKRKFL